jgi:hypothetical protein
MRYARKFQACLLPYRNIAGLAPITAANTASDAFKAEALARKAAFAAVDAASAALKAKMVRAGSGIMRYARKFQACLLPYRNIAGLAPIT